MCAAGRPLAAAGWLLAATGAGSTAASGSGAASMSEKRPFSLISFVPLSRAFRHSTLHYESWQDHQSTCKAHLKLPHTPNVLQHL